MASAQQLTPRRRVILHHLSDLRYTDSATGRSDDMLVRYRGYLEGLPTERYPDLVVITGDLTDTGKRNDLSAVAITLRACFPKWAGRLHERVFVVPGPRDVNWESVSVVGLQAFFEIFSDFALPYHTPLPSGHDTVASGLEHVICYPIDTCYSPDALQPELKEKFTDYARFYDQFIKRRDALNKRWLGMARRPWRLRRRDRDRAREDVLALLRKEFLELTEGARLIDLRAGRITARDIERLERWTQTPVQSVNGAAVVENPLKILITHHPFAIHPEQDADANDAELAQHSFKQVAKAVRAAGFHLALHGHIHNPQIFSDMSMFEGPTAQPPIRQQGAASLGKIGIFNEITAVYREEQGQDAWRLDLRMVDLNGKTGATPIIELLNPAEVADRMIKQKTREAQQRSEFEQSMRFAMRRYSEQVNEVRSATWQERQNGAPLPQVALQHIDDIIRLVIFKGYEVRVRLLLKKKDEHEAIPKLVATYLTPAVMEGPDALLYPASVAAWSLVLGRTLLYPRIESQSTMPEDHDWLRRTNKFPELLSTLKMLMQDAAQSSFGFEAGERYQSLYNSLEAIRGAPAGARDYTVAGKTIYQSSPDGSPPRSYPTFICVPYPLRPTGGAPPSLPEIAVLDVGARPVEHPDHQGASSSAAGEPFAPFTSERIEMLETLAELIGAILTTSDALGRPRGVWDDRSRPGV